MFEYYVLNYNHNAKKVEMFNIFNNYLLNDAVQKEVKKYIRSPKKYTIRKFDFTTQSYNELSGFEAFKTEILDLIKWQEYGRYEYEIGVTEAFANGESKIEKWDCYMQCEPNIETICFAIIKQYQSSKKKRKE